MKKLLYFFSGLLIFQCTGAQNTNGVIDTTTIYSFSMKTIEGNMLPFTEFKGKTLLIVNTASKCGFTYQYEGLQKLHEKYKDKGLVILGFPCNQFANQEPGTNENIKEFCSINYGVTFQMFDKIDVNGENEAPLYTFLKAQKGGVIGKDIKWNFTKFLIDKNGIVVERFSPQTKPESIESTIELMLQQ